MIEVRPFKAEDYDKARGYPAPADMDDWKADREFESNSFSFVDGEEVIAVCGKTPLWPGTAEAWLIHDKRFYRYWRDIIGLSGTYLDRLQEGVRHLYCDTIARDKKARSYLEHYGFTATGYFESFTEEGEDVMRFSRVVG